MTGSHTIFNEACRRNRNDFYSSDSCCDKPIKNCMTSCRNVTLSLYCEPGFRLYFKKRKVAASSSANPEIIVVEGEGDRQENTMEIVAGTSASPEIVELQVAEGDRLELTVEEGRSEQPEEISECTEEVWGPDDKEEIVLEGEVRTEEYLCNSSDV